MGVDYTQYGFQDVVDLIPNSEKTCLLLRKCFSRDYCHELLASVHKQGFQTANDKYPKTYRNNERFQRDDTDLAAELFDQCKKLLPKQLKIDNRDLHLAELNSRLRYCKYSVGQKFSIHQDGVFYKNKRQYSVLTFLLYLNDSDKFTGGETKFYLDQHGKLSLANYRAKTGDVLAFEHDIWHSGGEVEFGNKYILRSDFIYEDVSNKQTGQDKELGNTISDSDKHHRGYIWKIASLPNQLIATASRDRSIKIWNYSLELQQRLDCHENSVLDLSQNLNGDIFAVSRDGFMSRWVKTNEQYQLNFKVDTKHPCALSIHVLKDGNIVTTGSDNIIKLWNQEGKALVSSQVTNDWQWQVFELNNEQLVSVCADGCVYFWKLSDLSLIKIVNLDLGAARCFVANKKYLFVGYENGLLAVIDLTDFKIIKKWQAHNGTVRDILLFNDSLFSCGEDNMVNRFDIFGKVKTTLCHHSSFATSLTRVRNNIFSVSYDGRIICSRI